MIYLASPYMHKDSMMLEYRYRTMCEVTGMLLKLGFPVFSPVVQCHHIHISGKTPGDWAYWKTIDEDYIKASDELCVVMLDGWKKSVGVQAELKIAKRLAKKITYLEFHTEEDWRFISCPE
jgi:hypothetical protein